ncbi:hypothetical protein [Variovorax atrisoli]|uniref:hypothetical protein n=1 Tax=Variovorax atrisoli TaxID=3394203 RepID=UPI00037DB1CF|nr:hypothetical protein [Variovorax paradoxus]
MTAMNNDLRNKALARLAASRTSEAQTALRDVFNQACTELNEQSQFDKLASALEVLQTIAHRFPEDAVTALATFLKDAETRSLTYAEGYEVVANDEFFGEVYGAPSLMVKAIEAMSTLRYLVTASVLGVLHPLSAHHLDKIRKAAIEHLEHAAAYNISVFFGTKEVPGIGAYPQQQILTFVEQLKIEEVKTCWAGTLVLIEKLLSEEVRGTEWSYNQVVISHIAIPASDQVAEVRQRAIAWVIGIYPRLDAVRHRSRLLNVLHGAIRNPRGAGEASVAMISKDALTVVQFFRSLAATELPQLVEKIEHHSYWIFFHSPAEEVRAAALDVKTAADGNSEYQIFKVLIGFEGIFGEWTRERNSEGNWDRKDKLRKALSTSFIESIAPENESVWLDRILRYSQIESDDMATFPVYIDFLERLAAQRGDFALRLIQDHGAEVDGFLVPLLRGLATTDGGREIAWRIIDGWLLESKYLLQIAYSLDDSAIFSPELLARVLDKAIEAKQIRAIVACMSSAVSNFSVDHSREPIRLFALGLTALTALKSSAWIFELWFRPKIKEFLGALDATLVDSVLENLENLEEIDYHAEEVLYILAQAHAGRVLKFFVDRLKAAPALESSKFEAVPFELHKVNEALAQHPRDCVAAVRPLYDGDYAAFLYGGGRLLKNIFPALPPEFAQELGLLMEAGSKADIEVVLAVLRNYDGKSAVAPLCLKIVDLLPEGDELLEEIEVVLESTGVVTGEFGFAEAMEEKRQEASAWLNSGSDKTRKFAETYIAALERRIVAERARATESIVLRKAQYGEYD